MEMGMVMDAVNGADIDNGELAMEDSDSNSGPGAHQAHLQALDSSVLLKMGKYMTAQR